MGFLRWCRRIAALVTAAALGVLIPAVAWAHTNPVAVAVGDELAKRRRSSSVKATGAVTLFGFLCCLLFVASVVLVVILITRRKRR